jgi:hypothetical protein
MNTLVLVSVMFLSQIPPSPGEVTAKSYAIDSMTTQQQREWLLAHMMVDLRFDDKKMATWEKKLSDMTPTQVAVAAKAYILQQEKKQLQEDRNYAMRMAKMQAQAHTYWYKTYYKYKSYNYTSYPNYGYGWGYPLRPIYVGRIYR